MKYYLLKIVAPVLVVTSMVVGSIFVSNLFDTVPWAITRWIFLWAIVVMMIILYGMHIERRTPVRFNNWAWLLYITTIIEIGALISLITFQTSITPETDPALLDNIINAIIIVIGVFMNAAAGLWVMARMD